jgi:hypothetical protein
MSTHETKARIDSGMDEWKRNLETMKAKTGSAASQADVKYRETVAQLQKQFDDLKIKSAKAWDVADDSFDSARKDVEASWDEWEIRAKKAWEDLSR